MSFARRWRVALLVALAVNGHQGFAGVTATHEAAATSDGRGIRRQAFSFGFTGARRSLRSASDQELVGNSGAVQVGYAYLSDSWYADLSFDLLLGPYEPAKDKQLDVDYLGTGFTLWLGASAQAANLRSSAGGYGFALGISYADLVGHSIGRNHLDVGDGADVRPDLIDDYVLTVTDLSLQPAIFFAWLGPPRPRGNAPDLLATRVEGYILTVGASVPLNAAFKATTHTKGASQSSSDSGALQGYSILVSLKAMLGT